jgi:hypothetical protein
MDSELEASKDKLKKKQENLRASMVTYERKQGAIPPGAKESEPGHANHSTNCGLGQPAAFAYTHSMEQPNATPASSKAKKRGPSPAPSSSGRSSSINSAALEEVSGFNTAFQRLVDRLPPSTTKTVPSPVDEEMDMYNDVQLASPDRKKLDGLQKMRKRTLVRINSYKPFIDTDATAKKEYTQRIAKLAKIDKKIEKMVGDDDSLSLSDSSRTTLGN